MHSMTLSLCLIIIASVVLDQTALAAFTCSGNNNCLACVKDKTYSGKPCRWCLRDNKCHTEGSLYNGCKKAENIIEKSHCSDQLSTYNPSLSNKMLWLSSVAYDEDNPELCLNKILPDSDFTIYRIATKNCDFLDNRCSGYVAVSHLEKSIAVVFRGSKNVEQVLLQFLETLTVPKTSFFSGKVQYYWKKAYDKLWPCIKNDVLDLIAKYPHYKVWVTGHSLGGAIASMVSTELAYKYISRKDIAMYTFGMPRLGDYDYAYFHDQQVNNSWRVVNYNDFVPHFPSIASLTANYHHGIEAYYTTPATNPMAGYKECHDLPYNEDKSCSFTHGVPPWGFSTHVNYFGVRVGEFCDEQTKTHFSGARGRQDVYSENSTFEFLPECSVYQYNNYTDEYVKVPVASAAVKHSPAVDVAVKIMLSLSTLYMLW